MWQIKRKVPIYVKAYNVYVMSSSPYLKTTFWNRGNINIWLIKEKNYAHRIKESGYSFASWEKFRGSAKDGIGFHKARSKKSYKQIDGIEKEKNKNMKKVLLNPIARIYFSSFHVIVIEKELSIKILCFSSSYGVVCNWRVYESPFLL